MRRRPGIAGLQRDVQARVRKSAFGWGQGRGACVCAAPIAPRRRRVDPQHTLRATTDNDQQPPEHPPQPPHQPPKLTNPNQQEQYRAAGEEVRRATAAQMAAALARFRARLEEFAARHAAEIRADPSFRAQFHAMCAGVGVDPLASTKGMFAELLGFGDYYFGLGVQILEACWASRPLNGGLMELSALRAAVLKRRGARADPVSEDDVLRALRKLRALGGGIGVTAIGRATYVRSVPGELNPDKNRALALAQVMRCVCVFRVCVCVLCGSRLGLSPLHDSALPPPLPAQTLSHSACVCNTKTSSNHPHFRTKASRRRPSSARRPDGRASAPPTA